MGCKHAFDDDDDDSSGQMTFLVCLQPFNRAYTWLNTSDNLIIPDPSISVLNTFVGSATQQSTSVVTTTNGSCYELDEGCYSVYGFEVVFLSDVFADVTLTAFTV